MELPSERVASRMFQSFECHEDKLVEDLLGVRAVQSASIEVAGQKLEQTKVRSNQTLCYLLLFHQEGLVGGREFLLDIERIRVPAGLLAKSQRGYTHGIL